MLTGQRDENCLEAMCDLIGASEEWLLERVVDSVRESGLTRSPRHEEDWRESVRGLSDVVFQALYAVAWGYAEGPVRNDPVVAYGIIRGRRHCSHGVAASDWHALMRHHRAAYIDLIAEAGFDEGAEEICQRFIHRVFDRIERGFRQGYAVVPANRRATARPLTADA